MSIRLSFAICGLVSLLAACSGGAEGTGATAGTGGRSETGGGGPGTGGTGGATAGTGGGAPTGTGGNPSGTGGGPSASGGAPSGTGGVPAGTGGSGPTGSGGGAGMAGNRGGAGGAVVTGSGGSSKGGNTGSGGNGTGGAVGGSAGPSTGGDDLPGSACKRSFTAPAFSALKSNPKMPDPFTFLDGTKVKSKEDWVCRQKEISVLAQAFIYGPKPPKPETMKATYSGGTLTLDMTNAGRSWTLSVPIRVPSGSGPFPALFDVDAGAPSGVASIGTGLTWLTGKVASAGGSRGATGPFYTFFPDSKKTGSLMAWAWAASRIIDGLEATTGHNIDTKRLYGLGCSRNGKTAAVMALFDRRVAMVAGQSPGSGMTSGWRPAQAVGTSVQTAAEIFTESTWMGEDFGQFGKAVDKLPIDQHEVLALAWPRPILIREGTMDGWNCPSCVYTTMKYAQLTYEALGDKSPVGFVNYVGSHCQSGGTEWTDTYNTFLKRYILPADGTTSTAGLFDDKFTFDKAKWQDGELTPIP